MNERQAREHIGEIAKAAYRDTRAYGGHRIGLVKPTLTQRIHAVRVNAKLRSILAQ